MEIRAMTESDIPGVSEVRVRAWQRAYAGLVPQSQLDAMSIPADTERRRGYFLDPATSADNLVAVSDGAVCGWACVAASRDEDATAGTGEIWAMYVHPSAWRQGTGRALMAAALARLAERELTPVTLWVLDGNTRARSFYERCGFVADGTGKPFAVEGGTVDEVRYRRATAGPLPG